MTVTASGFSGPTWVQYPGNGAAVTFNIPFLLTAATDLVVGFFVGGVYTQQFSGFTLAVIYPGLGTITFATAPPIGTTVDLRSAIPETQPTNFSNLGGYYPENTTNAMDRVTRLVADLYRLTYQFGIHGPDQESIPWPALPNAAARAGGGLVFDPVTGLPTLGVLTATPLTQSSFNGFLLANTVFPWGQTQAEIEASVIPVNYSYVPGNILRYGADPTGATSSLSALQQSIAQARQNFGAAVSVPAGVYNLGAGFIDAPTNATSGLKISGAGKNLTTFFSSSSVVMQFAAPLYGDLILTDFGVGNNNNQIIGTGIQISAVRSGSIFRNLAFFGNPTTGVSVGFSFLGLVSGTYSGEFEIEDSEFYNCLTGVSYNGIMTGGTTQNCRFTNGAAIANSVGIYQAATCISQIANGCQFFGPSIGILTFGQFFRQIANYFEACTTNSWQWNLGAGNTAIDNFSFGDMQLTSTPSYPSAAQYGCVVLSATAGGQPGISLGGALAIGISGVSPAVGLFGASPAVGPQSTWGTPTNGSVVANFPGTTATLTQCSTAIAELITYLKQIGVLAT